MDLNHAIAQLNSINNQLARSVVFRGYRSSVVGAVGVVACVASVIQARLLPQVDTRQFVFFWSAVAALVVVAVSLDLAWRCWKDRRVLQRAQSIEALRAIAPCLVAGAVLTAAIVGGDADVGWMLPGMWSVVFSLGAFGSRHFLQSAATWTGVFYLMVGSLLLLPGRDSPLAPWTMALSFGGGHFVGALLLYRIHERSVTQGQEQLDATF